MTKIKIINFNCLSLKWMSVYVSFKKEIKWECIGGYTRKVLNCTSKHCSSEGGANLVNSFRCVLVATLTHRISQNVLVHFPQNGKEYQRRISQELCIYLQFTSFNSTFIRIIKCIILNIHIMNYV